MEQAFGGYILKLKIRKERQPGQPIYLQITCEDQFCKNNLICTLNFTCHSAFWGHHSISKISARRYWNWWGRDNQDQSSLEYRQFWLLKSGMRCFVLTWWCQVDPPWWFKVSDIYLTLLFIQHLGLLWCIHGLFETHSAVVIGTNYHSKWPWYAPKRRPSTVFLAWYYKTPSSTELDGIHRVLRCSFCYKLE